MNYLVMLEAPEPGTWSLDVVRDASASIDATADVVVHHRPDAAIYDLVVGVTPADGSWFSVRRNRSGGALSTDGSPEQVAVVAAWARSLLPEVLPCNLMIVDQGYSERVLLPWGITPDEVLARWAPIP